MGGISLSCLPESLRMSGERPHACRTPATRHRLPLGPRVPIGPRPDTLSPRSFIKLRGADRNTLKSLSEAHGYLAVTLNAVLPAGYSGSAYLPINPLSVSQWAAITIGTAAGVGVLASIITAAMMQLMRRRERRDEPPGATAATSKPPADV